jgi:hypothetical protein
MLFTQLSKLVKFIYIIPDMKIITFRKKIVSQKIVSNNQQAKEKK